MESKPIYPNVSLIIEESPLKPFEGPYRYFEFSQNNSGGSFDRDENIAEYVIIAAKDADHANERAREIGIYFGGVLNGSDCDCCGDRWSEAWRNEGMETPMLYGQRPEVMLSNNNLYFRNSVIVHHANGMRETYTAIKDPLNQ